LIISLLGQKGGTGKSALARTLAVEFIRNGWKAHIADMDRGQQTALRWGERRRANGISPAVTVTAYQRVSKALSGAGASDVMIMDGKGFVDAHALRIALASTLVVIPVGMSVDDLEANLTLATGLVARGVSRQSMVFVVCRVAERGEKEAMHTRASIKDWGFNPVRGWLPFKTAYSKALDKGLALTETRFQTLNTRADHVVEQLVDQAIKNDQK